MVESFGFYSQTLDSLPGVQVESLIPTLQPRSEVTNRGLTHSWLWDDLEIICSEMPSERLAEHLRGFEGYVLQVCSGKPDGRLGVLISRIRATRLVVGVEVRPKRDPAGRADLVLGKLCGGLSPLMLYESAVFDHLGRLILGPDGSHDPEAWVGES